MNDSTHHPEKVPASRERIAALVDGRLQGREREELLAHLAASDDDLELLADAAATTRELEEEDAAAAGGVVPLRPGRRRGPPRWLAVAAVVAGLAVIPLLWSRLGGPGSTDTTESPVAHLSARGAALPEGWERRPWGTTRGAGDTRSQEVRAVRLGVHLVDLELAVAARDPMAGVLAQRVKLLLEEVPGTGPLPARYDTLAMRVGQPPEQLAAPLAEARADVLELLDEEEEGLLRLGEWAEAGRIAAMRRDTSFFRAPATRQGLERAAALPQVARPAREALERVRLASEPEREPDWAAIYQDLTSVLRLLGR